mmetsp:Transcript_23446/g.58875  ORF Transcript_23446/g.58875 Transcript_23446/m.58875 type:complete len:205 (-) Transcript_23446:603-1217(-)
MLPNGGAFCVTSKRISCSKGSTCSLSSKRQTFPPSPPKSAPWRRRRSPPTQGRKGTRSSSPARNATRRSSAPKAGRPLASRSPPSSTPWPSAPSRPRSPPSPRHTRSSRAPCRRRTVRRRRRQRLQRRRTARGGRNSDPKQQQRKQQRLSSKKRLPWGSFSWRSSTPTSPHAPRAAKRSTSLRCSRKLRRSSLRQQTQIRGDPR